MYSILIFPLTSHSMLSSVPVMQLALNVDKTITNNDPELGVGKLKALGEVIDELEKVGYESLHLYEDDNSGFERRSFLVALKALASRADWYSNVAEFDIRLHQRIGRTENMKFFDALSMIKYQLPFKAAETAYCRGGNDERKVECEEYLQGFDPDNNVPLSELSVGTSTMGEWSGRGLFATKDIPKGQTIGKETIWLSYFILPSTLRIIYSFYYWAEQNYGEDDDDDEVLDSISAVVSFCEGKCVLLTISLFALLALNAFHVLCFSHSHQLVFASKVMDFGRRPWVGLTPLLIQAS